MPVPRGHAAPHASAPVAHVQAERGGSCMLLCWCAAAARAPNPHLLPPVLKRLVLRRLPRALLGGCRRAGAHHRRVGLGGVVGRGGSAPHRGFGWARADSAMCVCTVASGQLPSFPDSAHVHRQGTLEAVGVCLILKTPCSLAQGAGVSAGRGPTVTSVFQATSNSATSRCTSK